MEKERVSVVKILIKDHHDEKDDLVSRPLVRAFNKIERTNIKNFVSEDGIYLYCCLENNELYEIFTQRKLEMDDVKYEVVPSEELIEKVKSLSEDEIGMIYSLIRKFVFGEDIKIDFVDVLTMDDNAIDRAILFKEYNNDLSFINPYENKHENDYSLSLIERYNIEKKIKNNIKSNTK